MEEIAILQINDITHNNLQTDFYANTLSQHLIDNHSHIERPHKHNFYVGVLFKDAQLIVILGRIKFLEIGGTRE